MYKTVRLVEQLPDIARVPGGLLVCKGLACLDRQVHFLRKIM